ncbi:MAG: ATPase [Chloroflexota bacterium]
MLLTEIDSASLTVDLSTHSKWIPIQETRLLILVGVTGVGKSTTVNALVEGGLSAELLPNRRDLTDQFIIGYLQRQAGRPVTQVTDRADRFDYTKQYRKQFPGGMAHALANLAINPQSLTGDWLIFDGLRGANEVTYASQMLPNARFLMLDAPDFIRVQRLMKRHDAFDQIQGQSQANVDFSAYSNLLSSAEISELEMMVEDKTVTLNEVQSKLAIVQKERQNYDPNSTKDALFTHAPDQTIYIDTAQKSVAEAAAIALARLKI